MRIEALPPDIKLYRGYCDDLASLLESQDRANRPCPGCHLPCPTHHSPVCACACAPHCPHARAHMSSDGKRFPIEPGIAPLVYAFLRLRKVPPCWSCEGHEMPLGSPTRPPRIIFYGRSALYPALIAEAMLTLLIQKKLSSPWEVIATPIGNALDATYTLQPEPAESANPALRVLQADVRVIAEHLQGEVLSAARRYQTELRAALRDAS